MVVSKESLWISGRDEMVQVNQRALIDKVLARYSGEFTVFRELLQNSDDAQSRAVEIRFETKRFSDRHEEDARQSTTLLEQEGRIEEQLLDLKTKDVHQWTFKNNGLPFCDKDWSRLKKIAEGSPDEEKIGAFGVGFYSLFSVTEEPLVISGDQWMAFYWKDNKDQLFVRRGQLPTSSNNGSWTTFAMVLREPAPMPVAFDFTRFLATSITFMRHLSEVTVYFNDRQLVKLTKSAGISKPVTLPDGFKNHSPSGIMTVKCVETTPISIQAEAMRWILSGTEKVTRTELARAKPTSFFSFSPRAKTPITSRSPAHASPTESVKLHTTSVSLSIFSALIKVKVDKKMSTELVRSTKKNPPSEMKFELIYTAEDNYTSTRGDAFKIGNISSGSIFQGLRADPDRTGDAKVFIGHSTCQSTGIGGHIAAPFIPTVERESIDFMDRYISVWNKELLYVGGCLSRAAYELELRMVKEHWNKSTSSKGLPPGDIRSQLISRVWRTLRFFEFCESHPSRLISEDMRSAFFSCCPLEAFPMISSAGVQPCMEIRILNPVLTSFVKEVPVIPDEILKGTSSIVAHLRDQELIRDVDFTEIIRGLRRNPLREDECIACLKWWITNTSRDQLTEDEYVPNCQELLDVITVVCEEKKNLPLNTIQTFLHPGSGSGALIPLDGPLPEFLLPVSISKHFKPESLLTCFSWDEFDLIRWLSFISNSKHTRKWPEHNLNSSSIWAEKVVSVISRGWDQLAEDSKLKVKELLSDKTCIPTRNGMKKPSDAYFSTVDFFPDLPIVAFPSGVIIRGSIEKLLQYLDVRKRVDLQVVFNRMVKTNEWTVMDLVKYLASIPDLAEEELERLKHSAAFPKEIRPGESFSKRSRFKAIDLYPPNGIFRVLGLPILDWGDPTQWREHSDEAKFLYSIGLRQWPSVNELIELCTSNDSKVQMVAFQYLIDHIDSQYPKFDSTLSEFRDCRFIPAMKGSESCLAKITQVFLQSRWTSMGYAILQSKYQSYAGKLRIREQPSAEQLVDLLMHDPPQTRGQATEWFSLLASRINGKYQVWAVGIITHYNPDFEASGDLKRLASLRFVPIFDAENRHNIATQWLCPSECYLGGEGNNAFYSKLFSFVDFERSGNAFLHACGTMTQPSVEQVALMLSEDPHRFYEFSGGDDEFCLELRKLAVNLGSLSTDTIRRMKHRPILLGLNRTAREANIDKVGDKEEREFVSGLKRPDEIIVADDIHAYQAFGHYLFTAPEEDILEDFYLELGSQRLSHVVEEKHEASAEYGDAEITQEIRALILERLPLFLPDHTHTHARRHTHTPSKVSSVWLSSENNFVVRAFGKLTVCKHLNFNGVHEVQRQRASAVSMSTSSGPIELWIAPNAPNAQPDMYEVAFSLNRLLLEYPKPNDALLFMTILSTDLESLKRRGYNVDRILRQQQEAIAAAADHGGQKAKEGKQLHRQLKAKQRAAWPKKLSLLSKDSKLTLAFKAPVDAVSKGLRNTGNWFNMTTNPGQPSANASAVNQSDPSFSDQNQAISHSQKTTVGANNMPGHFAPIPSTSSWPAGQSTATPLDDIIRNIKIALGSCKGESSDVVENRQHIHMIKESAENGYCDIYGRKGNLYNIDVSKSMKIYHCEEILSSQVALIMETKLSALTRFHDVLKDLANVYGLPSESLHIFFDLQGDVIAFNRLGSIFFNFRYYEQWHDAEVQQGNLRNAYISWYFSLAHEIAHNLVQHHNSEHAFYLSAISGHHMMAFTRLLNSSSGEDDSE